MFLVVEVVGSREVLVIPSCWTSSAHHHHHHHHHQQQQQQQHRTTTTATLPPYASQVRLGQAVRAKEQPKWDWLPAKIYTLAQEDTYIKAKKMMVKHILQQREKKKEEEKTQRGTNTVTLRRSKRKIRTPNRYVEPPIQKTRRPHSDTPTRKGAKRGNQDRDGDQEPRTKRKRKCLSKTRGSPSSNNSSSSSSLTNTVASKSRRPQQHRRQPTPPPPPRTADASTSTTTTRTRRSRVLRYPPPPPLPPPPPPPSRRTHTRTRSRVSPSLPLSPPPSPLLPSYPLLRLPDDVMSPTVSSARRLLGNARGSRILTILKEILAEQRSIRRMIELIMAHEGVNNYEEESVFPREE